MTTQPTLQSIPLNRLVPSRANVRRTGAKDGLDELAASIAAHGLRQNLNVRAVAESDRFEVVAGGRRLAALKRLAKEGLLPKDAPIPCALLGPDDDASEISLTENVTRLAHADQLADALALDMGAHWQASAEGFVARLTKAQMLVAVREAGVPLQVSIGAMKKQDAARYVTGALHGSGWLPAPLRRVGAEGAAPESVAEAA